MAQMWCRCWVVCCEQSAPAASWVSDSPPRIPNSGLCGPPVPREGRRAGAAVAGSPLRLADGGAEQVPDPVGEGQAEGAPDDYPQHGAPDVAAADASTEGTG